MRTVEKFKKGTMCDVQNDNLFCACIEKHIIDSLNFALQ